MVRLETASMDYSQVISRREKYVQKYRFTAFFILLTKTMKRILLTLTVLGLLLNCSKKAGSGQKTQLSGSRRLEILFLGHDSKHHNSEKFFPMLALPLFQKGINLTYTSDLNSLNTETLAKYDGLIIYANHNTISASQEAALKDFVEEGKALIPLHAASFCFQNSEWYIKTVGGQFYTHKYGTFTAPIVKKEHPVMTGLQEFETWDETYVHRKLNPDITILQERIEGDHHEPWTWVRTQGKGKVFYTAYGHDERTWKQTGFHQLVMNGILWAVDEKSKAQYSRLQLPKPVFQDADVPNYEKRDPAPQFQLPLSPEQSQKLIQVPVDFELRLFASEPDVVNPIAMAWDEKGRLFVIETEDYPNEIRTQDGGGKDRIKICEDTDRDGKADKFTVFAENLNIPTSLTFANGGLIVAQAPHFIFLKDTNGDDKADIRENIISGWGKSDTHAGPSSLKYGLDNKVWGVLGYAGFRGTINDKPVSFSQGIYRFDTDGKNLEYIGRTSNNTWGLGFSEDFEVFISTANGNYSGHFAMPLKYAKRSVAEGSGNTVYKLDSHYEMSYLTPALRQVDFHGGFTAAAGHNLYTARSFPKSYWNSTAFVCEPTGRLLYQARLKPKGAGYTEKNGFNLLASSDEWFAPVQAEVGPDGAVWVADWYNFIIQHNPTPRGFENGKGNAYINPLRDNKHGRIYRVVYKNAPLYNPLKLDKQDPKSLLAALKNDNMFWRTTAQRLIVESQNKELIPGLLDLVNDQAVDEIGLNVSAVHALWTLQGLGALEGENEEAYHTIVRAMRHPSSSVRKNAIKLLPRNEKTLSALKWTRSVEDPDLKVRLAAIQALTDLPESEEIGRILYLAGQDSQNAADEYVAQAIFSGVIKHEKGFKNAAANLKDSTLTARIERGLLKETYVLNLWSPPIYPPDVTGKEIRINALVTKADQSLSGVIVSQGNKENGYSLFIENSKINWLIKQDGKAYILTSEQKLPEDRFLIASTLKENGLMTLSVNGETPITAQAKELFSRSFSPDDIRLGRDLRDDNRVGNYSSNFNLKGWLDIKSTMEVNKVVEGEKKLALSLSSDKTPSVKKGVGQPVIINLKVIEHEMKFDKNTFTVKAGQKVTLRFTNPDFMQHNLLIASPGSLEKVGAAADLLAREANAIAMNYVPKIPEVLYATELVSPEGNATLELIAPEKPGDYPFLCTVPGHWRIMNGMMKVQ
ncbi:putative membrane-bound dehydrogenase domain-containing protein [Dyadobacter koreensis]|uniref:Putative membrane-bound dehydrogenase domain-containing protein n=2 Tax=Dyadobacter koreensis TaxID=408657 RepID=A0A1H6Q0V1_9BACT|nr:putative membrane-bound dehydrogenase domain-containing protein [Dyadobacter koreensis]